MMLIKISFIILLQLALEFDLNSFPATLRLNETLLRLNLID